jgi:hypothetical protein
MKRLAITTLAALGALLTAAPGALADNFTCSGTVATPMTIDGNLVVPNNAHCFFSAPVTVTGNVTVGNGASFVINTVSAGTTSIIGGNLQASNCAYVEINPLHGSTTHVGRNVQIQNCTGTGNTLDAGEAFGYRSLSGMIGGNSQCNNNTGACVQAFATIGGNVQFVNNVSAPGTPSEVADNIIMQNLQCQNNSPTPTNGGLPNTVLGTSQGQCLNF